MTKALFKKKAEFAYNCVLEVKQAKEYKSIVKSFPVMVMTNGLIQALAYVKDKNKDFFNHLEKWLKEKSQFSLGDNDVIKKLIEEGEEEYRFHTDEILSLANWFKRFVDSEIED